MWYFYLMSKAFVFVIVVSSLTYLDYKSVINCSPLSLNASLPDRFPLPRPLGFHSGFSLVHKTRSAHILWVFSLPCARLPQVPGGRRFSWQGLCLININMDGVGTPGSFLLLYFFSSIPPPFSSQLTMQTQLMCFLNPIWHSQHLATWSSK